ncbi:MULTISPECIES: ABC transporter permease subunit [Eisenbergiella]|uniref:Sugar ABC transporter permease n=1 Tax=Eisenbergiella porci TaxID=2652274 RepID=A0A6N7WCD8_9FIRM|nr:MULTISPECIES: ABC transporter permease subunit [Eisenbergiella]MDY2653816.1 ABC transporter permease subunit [Eisenbergiella porci]MDY5525781.1 ABC transporter permease subunit [Eisenbergiella porci]MSS87405.1 sugar ABC transporter permease [Eisenbergiella porci]
MNILYICFYSCTNIIRHYDETATFCVPFQILFRRITQSLMFLPYFISWVVVGAFVYNMFNYEFGAVNTLLRQLGLNSVDIYSNPKVWIPILIGASLLKNLGYGTVMYLASVVNIDDQLYEAADVDGATMWQKIWNITLPCIRPTMVILILLSIGTIMKGDFQMFWQVTGNNPMTLEVTDVIDTYVTRSLMYLQEFGMTSAAGLYQSVFSFILIMLANYAVKKVEPDYTLF